MKNHIITKDNFYSKAKEMRNVYENNFKDPRHTHNGRFVWDYWHVPEQYTLMRTPAHHYFPQKLYADFHKHLVQWGRENLGCHDVSAPWMSMYIDGCKQELHSDVPHGPWAYVFSLTPWKGRQWSGGETLIVKPQVLDYWSNFVDEKDREVNSFVDKVPSLFNRLTVFDPRFPHGVTEVHGTKDPMDARLVIHGWFVEPRPYVVGPLSTTKVHKTIDAVLNELMNLMPKIGDFHGTISFRIEVAASGQAKSYKVLTNTVRGLNDHEEEIKMLNSILKKLFLAPNYGKASGVSNITVPLLFK